MDLIREYLLSVVSAALICSVIGMIIEKNSTIAGLFRLLSGLFMAITVLSPFLKLEVGDPIGSWEAFRNQSEAWVAQGKDYAQDQLCAFIRERTTTYIMDKANALGFNVQTELTLSTGGEPIPWSVQLSGDASPYARQQLMHYIETELGIPKERQSWN